MQLAFFDARRNPLRGPTECLRGIKNRLKGAVTSDEILEPGSAKDAAFLDVDPREGFSVRNFHIQVAKMAVVSDIVVYRYAVTSMEETQHLAKRLALAQSAWRESTGLVDHEQAPTYHTFLLSGMLTSLCRALIGLLTHTDSFEEIEGSHPQLIATGSGPQDAEDSLDFCSLDSSCRCRIQKANQY